MDSKVQAKINLANIPEQTHTRAELDKLHACIRFTHMFMNNESKSKIEIPGGVALNDLGIGRF